MPVPRDSILSLFMTLLRLLLGRAPFRAVLIGERHRIAVHHGHSWARLRRLLRNAMRYRTEPERASRRHSVGAGGDQANVSSIAAGTGCRYNKMSVLSDVPNKPIVVRLCSCKRHLAGGLCALMSCCVRFWVRCKGQGALSHVVVLLACRRTILSVVSFLPCSIRFGGVCPVP